MEKTILFCYNYNTEYTSITATRNLTFVHFMFKHIPLKMSTVSILNNSKEIEKKQP